VIYLRYGLCVDHFWGINIGGICNLRLFFGEKKGKLIDDLWPIFNQKGIKILFLWWSFKALITI
jgi:hypothetical protein